MIIIVLVTLVVCTGGYFWITDSIFSNAMPRAAILGFSPSDQPRSAVIDSQLESHTCGLHSLRSVYRAYELNPDEHSLRMRLGVDVPANPADDTSTGTLQADLTRVLAQDGFSIEALDLDDARASQTLQSYLATKHKAMALICKPDNGNLHWIVLQEAKNHRVEIIDPLAKTPGSENTKRFISKQAVTVLLLGVESEVNKKSIKAAHRLGVAEMKNTPGRVKRLGW